MYGYQKTITATEIEGQERYALLNKVAGVNATCLQGAIFNVLAWLSETYRKAEYLKGTSGRTWRTFVLSNGGFYMAPATQTQFKVSVECNYHTSVMSADAVGVTACLFAFGQLAEITMESRFVELRNALYAWAAAHPEWPKIRGAID